MDTIKRRMTKAVAVVFLAAAPSAAPTTLPIMVGKTQTIVPNAPPTPSGPINIGPGIQEGGGIVLDPDGTWAVRGLAISNSNGPCITVDRISNVRIVFNKIGPCGGYAIVVTNAAGVTIANNSIKQVAGAINVDGSTGAVQVLDNRIVNVTGGANGISFQRVTGAGHRIMRNFVRNEGINPLTGGPPASAVSDVISLFVSSGTAADPIRVDHNILIGSPDAHLPSTAGISLGDGCDIFSTADHSCQKNQAAVQWRSAYQSASGNILINAAEHGVTIMGGKHISASDNVVFGTGPGNPIQTWDFHFGLCFNETLDAPGCAPAGCEDVTISNNQVNFDGKRLYYPKDEPKFPNSCGAIINGAIDGQDTNNWDNTTITPAAFHF